MKRLILWFLLLPLAICFTVGCNNQGGNKNLIMQAKIIKVNEDNSLLVEIIKDEYNSGEMCVLIGNKTKLVNKNGEKIAFSELNTGDNVQIEYTGQVMLSYPAKINAIKIVLL